MIFVIDDRQKRQEKNLAGKPLSEVIRLFSPEEINQFRQACEQKNKLAQLKEASLVCAHSSSLFNEDNTARDHLVDYCKQKGIPLILFSGAFSIATTIDSGKLFTANVSLLYQRLAQFREGKLPVPPEQFLFGDNYLLSNLFRLRRKAVVFSQNERLEELQFLREELPDDNLFETLFDQWEKAPFLELPAVLESINQAIQTFLAK